jgi:tight adherence protein B
VVTDAGPAEVADIARRAAVLLQAGVAPQAVWRYLAERASSAAAVLADLDRGLPVVEAIGARGESWRELAVAWSVASAVGAALAEALRSFALGLRDAAEAQDDVTVALAEPAATARLMLWLPAVGLVMGVALGFDTLGILFTDPRGIVCLTAGLALVVGARVWTARLIRRARPEPGLPGIDAELFAIALSGGVSIDAAAVHVGRARAAVDPDGAEVRAEVPAAVRDVLELSRAAGVPAVELLRAESASARHRARVDGRLRASKLGTRLLLPLGVCTLPSFLLLAVAPLVLSILGTTDLPAL